MEWIANNQEALIVIGIAIGALVVKATPTKVDDEWFQKVKGLLVKEEEPPEDGG